VRTCWAVDLVEGLAEVGRCPPARGSLTGCRRSAGCTGSASPGRSLRRPARPWRLVRCAACGGPRSCRCW